MLARVQVFAGSFRGKVLFENPEFIHPNAVRSYEKKKEAGVYKRRKDREAAAAEHKAANVHPVDKLSNKHVFAAEAEDSDEDEEVLDDALLDTDGDLLQQGGSDAVGSLNGKTRKLKEKKGGVHPGTAGLVEAGSDEEMSSEGEGFMYSAEEDDDLEGSDGDGDEESMEGDSDEGDE